MGKDEPAASTVSLPVPVRLPELAMNVVVPTASAFSIVGSPGFAGGTISAMELSSKVQVALLSNAPFSSSNCIARVSPTNMVAWLGFANSGSVTVNWTPLLEERFPFTMTVAVPGLRPDGTRAVIVPALQFVIGATIPLNFTMLCPCELPKAEPVSVTVEPIPPKVGKTEEICGVGTMAEICVTNASLGPFKPVWNAPDEVGKFAESVWPAM